MFPRKAAVMLCVILHSIKDFIGRGGGVREPPITAHTSEKNSAGSTRISGLYDLRRGPTTRYVSVLIMGKELRRVEVVVTHDFTLVRRWVDAR